MSEPDEPVDFIATVQHSKDVAELLDRIDTVLSGWQGEGDSDIESTDDSNDSDSSECEEDSDVDDNAFCESWMRLCGATLPNDVNLID